MQRSGIAWIRPAAVVIASAQGRRAGSRGQAAFLEDRRWAHARVEDQIRTGKDTGLGHLPSRYEQIDAVGPS